ncbi:NADPH:quinone reductase [Cellulomonas sp. URHD0024]|uniref:NADPH:quinone reductase n=1 Tax=Cellulomonas sp. URHD0024 TaxID=1302620 RepID=UPI0004104793|nr:NADPH:quinone reductase [Cellulomonas sp. URHD0024]
MKAVVYDRTGPSSVLTVVERAPREPDADEVRVRVVVSGVNPTDWKARRGRGDGAPLDVAKVPNQDGAGVVDAVGAGVSGLRPGDRVWLWDVAWQTSEGTAQELVTLPATHAVALPDDESFDAGASLGIPALTAHLALTAAAAGPARLAPGALDGRWVLVTGGAGAVGHAAIQLAVWAGAQVITTISSPEKAELARAAGAHHVVDYRTEDVASAVHALVPTGVDVVVDVDIARNATSVVASVAANGTIAAYATADLAEVTLPVMPLMARNVAVQFVLTYTVSDERKRAAVGGVSHALADGALRVGAEHGLPITRFPLTDTAGAHDAVEAGSVGKVLIDVDG